MKPILFNTEMVREILRGRKTVTRRVVKERGWKITGRTTWADESTWKKDGFFFNVCSDGKKENAKTVTCHLLRSPYNVDDILWVRETWAEIDGEYVYRADDESPEGWHLTAWKPSIHMPREAARIFLRVIDVRVERLMEITEEGAKAEGAVKPYPYTDPETGKTAYMLHEKGTYRSGFSQIWDSTVPKRPNKFKQYPYYWTDNPWVWVIQFERISEGEAKGER